MSAFMSTRPKKHSALRDAAGRKGPNSTSIRSANLPRLGSPPAPKARASSFGEFMTSDDSLSLILRRLDEIERKLDDVLQELRTPAAIGYSVRRGNLPRKD
jgi:hypothetical protein